MEIKIIPVRTVCADISTLVIAFRILVNTFSIHPFIKGSAVVEHTVQYDSHASAMRLCHYLGKHLVARL